MGHSTDLKEENQQLITLYGQDRYTKATALLESAPTAGQQAAPLKNQTDLATSLNAHARFYATSRYAEAGSLYRRATNMTERRALFSSIGSGVDATAELRREHGRFHRNLRLLGDPLRSQPEDGSAGDRLGEEWIRTQQGTGEDWRTLDKAYPRGKRSKSDDITQRAKTLIEQGRHAEAFSLLANTLKATTLDNLAGDYTATGRYVEAEALFRRALAIWEKTLGPDHPEVAICLNGLARLYRETGRYVEAEAQLRRALAIDERALGENDPKVATVLNNLAAVYQDVGRYVEAEALLRRALAIHERALGADDPKVATDLNNLAALYQDAGRYVEAETLLQRALIIRYVYFGPDHLDFAISLNNIAELYRDTGRYSEAEPLYQRMLFILNKALGPNHPDLARCLLNLAKLYRNAGRYGEAEPLFQRALAINERALASNHPDLATSLYGLATLYQYTSRYADAEPLFQRALAIWEKALGPDHPYLATGFRTLAELFRDTGRNAEAEPLFQRATDITEKRGISFSGGSSVIDGTDELRRSQVLFHTHLALLADLLQAQQGDSSAQERLDKAFHVAQLALITTASAAFVSMGARVAVGNGELANLIRERQDTVVRWRTLDRALIQSIGRSPALGSRVAEEPRAQLYTTGQRVTELERTLRDKFPAFAELDSPRSVPLSKVQNLLAGDEALLVYVAARNRTTLFVVRHGAARLWTLDLGTTQLDQAVRHLRAGLEPPTFGIARPGDLPRFDLAAAAELYAQLIAPAADMLEGVNRLMIVPDGPLRALPFAVLLVASSSETGGSPVELAAYRDLPWLAARHALVSLPSVSSLTVLRDGRAHRSAGAKPFLGVGDPLFAGDPTPAGRPLGKATVILRGGVVDVASLRVLPRLPETADELRAIATALGAKPEEDVWLQERASKSALKQVPLTDYRILALATHGLVAGEIGGLREPALALTPSSTPSQDDDGLLTASEIAALHLDADWVVLSACNTAAAVEQGPGAEYLSGLARAFFYAGARSLLVSHWAVDSRAAAQLTTATFAALAREPGLARDEALRRAMLALMHDDSMPYELYAHPMFWAPFIVVGGVR